MVGSQGHSCKPGGGKGNHWSKGQSCQDSLQQLELHPADGVSEALPCPTVWVMLNASWAEQPWVAPGVQAEWVRAHRTGQKNPYTPVSRTVSQGSSVRNECPGTWDQGIFVTVIEHLILEHSWFPAGIFLLSLTKHDKCPKKFIAQLIINSNDHCQIVNNACCWILQH